MATRAEISSIAKDSVSLDIVTYSSRADHLGVKRLQSQFSLCRASSPAKMPDLTLAFFGATGGCACSCLARSIRTGYKCSALVRDPTKLAVALEAQGVAAQEHTSLLKVVEGDVRDIDTVTNSLHIDGRLVDKIISGIGGVPHPQLSLFRPLTMMEGNICSDATKTILAALDGAERAGHKPTIAVISSVGVQHNVPRDYPLMLAPLMRWMLNAAFDDKRDMEEQLKNSIREGSASPLDSYTIVRPTVLADGDSKGMGAIREGVDGHPVIGWSISRAGVGLWMFTQFVEEHIEESFKNTGICITY